MTVVQTELYVALLEAGVSDKKSEAAASAILNLPPRSGPGRDNLRRVIRSELGVARAELDLQMVKTRVLLVAAAIVLNNAVAWALR